MTDHPAPNPNQPDALVAASDAAANQIRAQFPDIAESKAKHAGRMIARAVLAAVLPEERHAKAAAWDEGWGSGYVDRHRERVGDDGHVVRNPATPNPYREKGDDRG